MVMSSGSALAHLICGYPARCVEFRLNFLATHLLCDWVRISDIAEEMRRKKIETELNASGWVSADKMGEGVSRLVINSQFDLVCLIDIHGKAFVQPFVVSGGLGSGDRPVPIGMLWVRISDIAEEMRRKKIETELNASISMEKLSSSHLSFRVALVLALIVSSTLTTMYVRPVPIGMLWVRISDIAEEMRRKKIETELNASGWVSARCPGVLRG
jgi:hypothetical protein